MAEAVAVVGVVASVVSLVDGVKELVLIIKHLHGTIEHVPGNISKSKRITQRIYDTIQKLEVACARRGPDANAAPCTITLSVQSFVSDLESIKQECDQAFPSKSRFGRTFDSIKQWLKRGDIAERLKVIQQRVTDVYEQFTAVQLVAVERAVAEGRESSAREYFDLRRQLNDVKELVAGNPQNRQGVRHPDRVAPSYPGNEHAQSPRTSIGSGSQGSDSTSTPFRLSFPSTTSSDICSLSTAPTEVSSMSGRSSQSRSSHSHYGDIGNPTSDTIQALNEIEHLSSVLREGRISKPDIAQSLDRLSIALHDIGFYEQSCEISERAVQIYTGIYRNNPTCVGTLLAGSIYNLANHLLSMGDPNREALGAAQKAVALYRSIVGEREIYKPELAMALNLTSVCLRLSARGDGAFCASNEAVRLMRDLVEEHPVVFVGDLVNFLDNRANVLLLRKSPDALLAAKEALDICRDLSVVCPSQHRLALSSALSTYGACYVAAKDYEEAIPSLTESLDIRRTLAADRPRCFSEPLAHSLSVPSDA